MHRRLDCSLVEQAVVASVVDHTLDPVENPVDYRIQVLRHSPAVVDTVDFAMLVFRLGSWQQQRLPLRYLKAVDLLLKVALENFVDCT